MDDAKACSLRNLMPTRQRHSNRAVARIDGARGRRSVVRGGVAIDIADAAVLPLGRQVYSDRMRLPEG